jgi:hypothetical protein
LAEKLATCLEQFQSHGVIIEERSVSHCTQFEAGYLGIGQHFSEPLRNDVLIRKHPRKVLTFRNLAQVQEEV